MLCVCLTALLCLLGSCISQTMPQTPPDGPQFGVGSSNQMNEPASGYCSKQEQQQTFNNCLFSFGAQHRRYFSFLASHAPMCRTEVFDCQAANSMINCLNTQPTTTISNKCWILLELVINKALRDYKLPCTFKDIEQHCGGASKMTQLLPPSKRVSTGRGVNNNPMRFFRDIVARVTRRITLNMWMMHSGGFGM